MPTCSRSAPLIAALLALALALTACGGDGQATTPAPGPVEVAVAMVETRDVLLDTELPGRTVAYRVAEVRPQAGGIIERRRFTEGEQVAEGETLYQIDPDSYRAQLARAEAAVEQAKAQADIARLRAERLGGLGG